MLAQMDIPFLRQPVDEPETEVVPIVGVLVSGVTEAYDQTRSGHYVLASRIDREVAKLAKQLSSRMSLPAPCLHASLRQVSGIGFTGKTAAGELQLQTAAGQSDSEAQGAAAAAGGAASPSASSTTTAFLIDIETTTASSLPCVIGLTPFGKTICETWIE